MLICMQYLFTTTFWGIRMTNALLTMPWTTNSVREDGKPFTLQLTHEEVIRLVLWPAGNDKHDACYKVTSNASMSDFIDDVLVAVFDRATVLITLSDAETAIREVLAAGLLRADWRGYLVMNRAAYRAIGLRPPFWLWK